LVAGADSFGAARGAVGWRLLALDEELETCDERAAELELELAVAVVEECFLGTGLGLTLDEEALILVCRWPECELSTMVADGCCSGRTSASIVNQCPAGGGGIGGRGEEGPRVGGVERLLSTSSKIKYSF
jgi:hypothetical protein